MGSRKQGDLVNENEAVRVHTFTPRQHSSASFLLKSMNMHSRPQQHKLISQLQRLSKANKIIVHLLSI